jgi:hypothetical protein
MNEQKHMKVANIFETAHQDLEELLAEAINEICH